MFKIFEDELSQIEDCGEAIVNLSGRKFKIKKQFVDDLKEASILDGIANMKKALLVMHSPTDDSVSIEHASKIFFSAAKHPRSFYKDYIQKNKVDTIVKTEKQLVSLNDAASGKNRQ